MIEEQPKFVLFKQEDHKWCIKDGENHEDMIKRVLSKEEYEIRQKKLNEIKVDSADSHYEWLRVKCPDYDEKTLRRTLYLPLKVNVD